MIILDVFRSLFRLRIFRITGQCLMAVAGILDSYVARL